MSVTTSKVGSATYPCGPSSGIANFSGFTVFCDEEVDGQANASRTVGTLGVPVYTGPGAYTYTPLLDGGSGYLQFTVGNYFVGDTVASPGYDASTCTITLDGPQTLSKGAPIRGSFHCDGMSAAVLVGDGGYHPPIITSADGTFDGVFSF